MSRTRRCPLCGDVMILKIGGAGGHFLGCTRFPDCRGYLPLRPAKTTVDEIALRDPERTQKNNHRRMRKRIWSGDKIQIPNP